MGFYEATLLKTSFLKTSEELARLAAVERADFYDVEMLIIYWETKPEIVARLLPPPLQPVARPLVMAFVANYPRTNFGPGYFEGALFLRASFEGQAGNYCLGMPVSGDMAMALGREKYGFPKKVADISLKRQGEMIEGSMSRRGRCFFAARARLNQAPNAADFPAILAEATAPDSAHAVSYNFKSSLAPAGRGFSGFDAPPCLVRSETILRPTEMLFGRAEVAMQPSASDPWAEVAVARLLGALYMTGNNSLLPGEVIASVEPETFAPYAYLKWDW